MRITKPATFGNTPIAMGISFRRFALYIGVGVIGFFLLKSPLFSGNWLAIAGYLALAFLIVGETPTGRGMLVNAYGTVFKKPLKMAVAPEMTVTTFGHGIREIKWRKDLDVPTMTHMTGNVLMVYTVTSELNDWTSPAQLEHYFSRLNALFNILEEGESYSVVVKKDNDTGMMQLREMLDEQENFTGGDLEKMSNRRKHLLETVATSDVSRSVQQHVILNVKEKNAVRVRKVLFNTARIIRPATNPGDILLAAMGFEGGDYCE